MTNCHSRNAGNYALKDSGSREDSTLDWTDGEGHTVTHGEGVKADIRSSVEKSTGGAYSALLKKMRTLLPAGMFLVLSKHHLNEEVIRTRVPVLACMGATCLLTCCHCIVSVRHTAHSTRVQHDLHRCDLPIK